MPTARVLMCPPTHFGVDYVINPWMSGHVAATDRDRAQAQWDALRAIIALHAQVELVAPGAGLPDMPFTANAGLVDGNRFVPSRFRHAERRGEEALFTQWARDAGFGIVNLPGTISFEGAGDALLDRGMRRLWMGHGHRSDLAAATALSSLLDVDVLPLQLVDPRFYHLDTCFCPLDGGVLLYYPPAFDAQARATIAANNPAEKRIAVTEADAIAFACNAVNLGRTVILNHASVALRALLEDADFDVVEMSTSEFLKAGGSTKCLTLRLDEPAT